MILQQNHFKCCICGEVFPCKRSDEEAAQEYKELFQDAEKAEDPCCEPCFIKVMDFNEPGRYRYENYVDKQ